MSTKIEYQYLVGPYDLNIRTVRIICDNTGQDIGLWLDREEAVREQRTEAKRCPEEIRMVSGSRRLSQGIRIMNFRDLEFNPGTQGLYLFR